MIRTLITAAHVVSCDETPIRVGPRKVNFEVFVLPELTGDRA